MQGRAQALAQNTVRRWFGGGETGGKRARVQLGKRDEWMQGQCVKMTDCDTLPSLRNEDAEMHLRE
jgi:hypothetical protein